MADSEDVDGWDESDSLDSDPSSGQEIRSATVVGDVVVVVVFEPSAVIPEKLDGNWWKIGAADEQDAGVVVRLASGLLALCWLLWLLLPLGLGVGWPKKILAPPRPPPAVTALGVLGGGSTPLGVCGKNTWPPGGVL